jgi:hypothetical protein
VAIPIVLLLLAALSAAVMAYGTAPNWAQYPNGFEFILLARRLQWPMVVISLALCLALLGLIIAGRRRAWWLIGLAPVLALFVHRFSSNPMDRFLVVEEPAFVAAGEAKFLSDDDWVVGLHFADADYAYPYACVFEAPVVIHADHDQRVAIMWSAYANRAIAVQIGRDLRAADLEVVSMPANALLLYNSRLGQFINGLTGLTPKGDKPEGFREAIPVTKTTWKVWRTTRPETKVLSPVGANYADAPRAPIRPVYPMPPVVGAALVTGPVAVVGRSDPIAFPSELVTATPLNFNADGVPVLVFRDARDGSIRAFERKVDDLRPRFRTNSDRKRPKALFVDEDTSAGWDANGRAVDGPTEFRGKRLTPIIAEDGLNPGVMKYWYPGLKLVTTP